jgi:hypothetical protein
MSGPEQSKRKESYDFRLFFGFHVGMAALMVFRFVAKVGIVFEIVVVACLLVIGVVLSLRHRRKHQWHWPGGGWKDVAVAGVVAALVCYFLGAVLPGTTVFNPNLFPWLAAGGGILVYGVLNALKVCHQTEDEFLRHCGTHPPMEQVPLPEPTKPSQPKWKRVVMGAFRVYFFAVWIAGVTFFWKFNAAYASGSQQPTATQTEKLTNHGKAVYITPEQKRTVKLFERSLTFGIPSVFVIAALLHFIVGVKLFDRGKENF